MAAPVLGIRLLLGLWLTILAGCAANGPLSRLARQPSPYEQYIDSLQQSGLEQTALGQDWLRAGDAALARPIPASLPFRETGYFAPDTPTATAWRVEVRRGRTLAIEVSFDTAVPGRLFVDVFRTTSEATLQRVTSLPLDTHTLTLLADQDTTYVVRVQPELLRGGRYTLVERTTSSLRFPVSGLTARAVQSLFGATRDAGTREHEGVDIFAPRGTPVVAVVDGVAQPATNGLGGNVVWLTPNTRNGTYYYAHLERWAFDDSTPVRAGEVVGYVGNTGNARSTAPHLHFGVYAGGAIDPWPFLQPDDERPPEPRGDLTSLGQLVRVVPRTTPLRAGPDAPLAAGAGLARGSVARVVGAAGSSFRVVLPDDRTGYVAATAVTPAAAALRRERVAPGATLRERPTDGAPVVTVIEVPIVADVLGHYDGFMLVRVPDGPSGWVRSAAADRTSS